MALTYPSYVYLSTCFTTHQAITGLDFARLGDHRQFTQLLDQRLGQPLQQCNPFRAAAVSNVSPQHGGLHHHLLEEVHEGFQLRLEQTRVVGAARAAAGIGWAASVDVAGFHQHIIPAVPLTLHRLRRGIPGELEVVGGKKRRKL